jgi:hypothetical protein
MFSDYGQWLIVCECAGKLVRGEIVTPFPMPATMTLGEVAFKS